MKFPVFFYDIQIDVSDEFCCIYYQAKFAFSTSWYLGIKLLLCTVVFHKVIRKQFAFSVSDDFVKSVRIRSASGPYFPAFRLNTERYYSVSLRIQSEWEKIRTRKTSNTDTFHVVDGRLKSCDCSVWKVLKGGDP